MERRQQQQTAFSMGEKEGSVEDTKTKRPKDAPFVGEEEEMDEFQLESPPSVPATSIKLNGLLHTMISSSLTPCDGRISCVDPSLTPVEY